MDRLSSDRTRHGDAAVRGASTASATASDDRGVESDSTGEARPVQGNGAVLGILRWLRERRLQPGDRLPSERDFAERLGVGRNAVREALASLVTLRMVESRPNSGIYLRHIERDSSFEALVMLTGLGAVPSATEVAETMEVRAHLEVLAAGLACERRTPQDLERLRAIAERTGQVMERGGNIVAQDTDFHVALVDATHNSVLVRVLNAFYRYTADRRVALFEQPSQAAASAEEHRRMIDLVDARDAAGAQALAPRHMARARDYWSDVLETRG